MIKKGKTFPSAGGDAGWWWLWPLMLTFVLAAGYGVNYLKTHTDLFVVRQIRIVGNQFLPAEEIRQLVTVQEGERLFAVDREALTRQMLRNKYIRGVSVVPLLPATLLLSIQERQPVLYLVDGKMWMVDETGIILPRLPTMPLEGIPLVSGMRVPDLLKDRTPLLQAIALLRKMKEVDPRLTELVSEIHIARDRWPELYLVHGGAKVLLGGANHYQRLYILSEFLARSEVRQRLPQMKRIDLTFANKVIVEYKQDQS